MHALSAITGTEMTKDGLYLKSKQGTRIFGIPVQLKDNEFAELSQIVADYIAKKDNRGMVDETVVEAEPEAGEGVSAVASEAEGIDEIPGEDIEY